MAGFDEARRAALDGGQQIGAAGLEQHGRNLRLAPVERRRHGPLPLHFARAAGTRVQVLFQAVLLFRHQLAVKIEGNQPGNRIASHTQSPNTARIFWVARKRQFLAASSVVPSISPMFRNRNPW